MIASVVPLVPAWRVDRPFDYGIPTGLTESIDVGSFVRVVLKRRKVRGIVVNLKAGDGDGLEMIASAIFDVVALPPPMLQLADHIASRYAALKAPTLSRMLPARIRIGPVEPAKCEGSPNDSLALYEGISRLVERLETSAPGVFCIQSAPGDDRAALTADLATFAGRAGRATLVCVPEVRFGSAVLEGLADRFPELARLDSTRSDAERASAWMAMAKGNWIGGGGRAAVLAPARPLGLLILDEEGHSSFKEDRSPRYDARHVAVERARLEGAVCVLMSQSPSVEAVALSEETIRPPRDALKVARPAVEIVDVPEDRAISHTLHERIRDALRIGQRVALLVPRRGYARTLWCVACRRSVRCSLCESSMAFDRAAARIRCPRCGLTAPPPDRCATCGSTEFRYLGAGSERLAEQVGRSFARARVVRVDPDTFETERGADDADIYVTTWIGTKPSLRPDVSLVGVLDADALIHRSDWRASESAFHAFWEMGAWAGPATEGGRLVLQTNQPDHHSVQAIARADAAWFADRELAYREELSYPPFSELIRVAVSGPEWESTFELVHQIVRAHGARMLGPVRSPRAGGGRRGLIKCEDATAVAGDLRGILAEGEKGTTFTIDTDPR